MLDSEEDVLRDDLTLVDPMWLSKLRRVGGDMSMFAVHIEGSKINIIINGYRSANELTRGDVKRIAEVLGLMLIYPEEDRKRHESASKRRRKDPRS